MNRVSWYLYMKLQRQDISHKVIFSLQSWHSNTAMYITTAAPRYREITDISCPDRLNI